MTCDKTPSENSLRGRYGALLLRGIKEGSKRKKLLDIFFMESAKKASLESTCKKRQIGCILITRNGTVSGANGAPEKIGACKVCSRIDAPSGTQLEHCYAVHAEIKVLTLCARRGLSTKGGVMYLWGAMPCKDCLMALIEAGVKEFVCNSRVYYDPLSKEIFKRWINAGGILRFMKNLCLCGCGEEVKEGRRYVQYHQLRGRHLSEETRKKIGEANRKRVVSEETREKMSESQKGNQNGKNHKLTKEHKIKISKIQKGNQHSLGYRHSNKTKRMMSKRQIIHGKGFLYNKHKQHRKQECLFGCENAKKYDLHHEPPIQENILEWEGRLINLYTNCHRKVHTNSLKLPDNVGILWTKENTEKEFGGINIGWD